MKMKITMEEYKQIREAQIKGARTIEELAGHIDFEITDRNRKDVEATLANACKCMGVSVAEVVTLVNNGFTTLEQIQFDTNATEVCGRCTALIQNIIDNKR